MDLTSNEPFWLVKNGLLYFYPSLKEDCKTKILIVGGGITGALMAHQCMEDGYETIVMKIQSECGFEKKESLYYAYSKKDIPNLKKEFKAREASGLNVKWLSKKEIQLKYGLHHAYAGILSSQGASIDAFRFTHDLLQYNIKRGLKVYDKTNITKTNYKSKKVVLTTHYDNKIQAEKVIYCNGYESTEMIKENFVKLLSTYVIIGEANDKENNRLENTLFWNTAKPYHYMRTTADHRLLVGGEDVDFVNPSKRDQLIAKKSKKLKQKIEKAFPAYSFRSDFALANRKLMMERVKDAFSEVKPEVEFSHFINKPHNFADIEEHFGEEYIVHRKGATRARKGEWGMIPGSQGTSSFLVTGKGNPNSFQSCSHGAGRVLSRTQARKQLSLKEEIASLKEQGILHAIRHRSDLDEAPSSYKDIDEVMANQTDLVDIQITLQPLAVVKA